MDQKIPPGFGERLKQLRISRGLTQSGLGQALDVSQETIASYERNSRFPRPATLQAIARLFVISLDDLIGKPCSATGVPAPGCGDFSLEDLIERLRQDPADRVFAWTAAWKTDRDLNLAAFYQQVLMPLLARIGLLWQQGALSVADEHLMSEKIRELALLHANADGSLAPAENPEHRWLGLCAPGEKHELALLMHSLVLRQAGWLTWYLGTHVPLADLLAAIAACEPRVVSISVTMPENLEGLEAYASRIRARFGRRPAIIIGGRGASRPSPGLLETIDAVAPSIIEGMALAEKYCSR